MQKAKSMKSFGTTLGKVFAAGAAAAMLASPLAVAAQPMTQPPPPAYQGGPDGWHGDYHPQGPDGRERHDWGDRHVWGEHDGWRGAGWYGQGEWAAYYQAYADWVRHYEAYYGYYAAHPVTYRVPIEVREPEVYE